MSPLTIGRFLTDLDRIVSSQRAAAWDVHGLQLGDPAAPAGRVAVCHEVTEAVVAAVEEDPVDLLVTYHPLLFRPTTRLVAGRSASGRAFRLLRAGAAVAVVHTAFDAARGGASDALAAAVGLSEVTGFGHIRGAAQSKIVTFVPPGEVEAVAAAMAAAGAGRIGGYSACSFRSEGTGAFLPGEGARPVSGAVGEPSREAETRLEMVLPSQALDPVVAALTATHPYEEPAYDIYEVGSNLGMVGRVGSLPPTEFSAVVRSTVAALGATATRAAGDGDRTVERVAVVPGSGGSLVSEAGVAGADVLVTGDVSHHTMAEAADRGLAVIDVGHAAGERPGMRALADLVTMLAEGSPGDHAPRPEVVDLTGYDPQPWT